MMYFTLGFPCGSAGKESVCNVRDLGSIPELGRSPGEGKGYPLWYSLLENSMDCLSPIIEINVGCLILSLGHILLTTNLGKSHKV